MPDTRQNLAPFWDERRILAADLVADGRLTQTAIAEKCGVSRATIVAWLADQRFRERVDSLLAETERRVLSRGVARRANRIRAKIDRWCRLRHVMNERAASAELASIPGGKSGLMVRTNTKSVRDGDNLVVHHFHAVDTGLLAAFLALEKDIAIECGQWGEATAAGGAVEMPKFLDLTKLTDEQLQQLGGILDASSGHGEADAGGPERPPGGHHGLAGTPLHPLPQPEVAPAGAREEELP